MDTFENQLEGFLKAAQAKVDAGYAEHNKATGITQKLELMRGPKYIRVVRREYDRNGKMITGSAYCFIDTSNGNVLKPAGFKAPEKKNPRSNINDADYGASGVTQHGTTYLR